MKIYISNEIQSLVFDNLIVKNYALKKEAELQIKQKLITSIIDQMYNKTVKKQISTNIAQQRLVPTKSGGTESIDENLLIEIDEETQRKLIINYLKYTSHEYSEDREKATNNIFLPIFRLMLIELFKDK